MPTRWTITNRSAQLPARLAWVAAAGAILLSIAVLPAGAVVALGRAHAAAGEWAAVGVSAVLGVLLAAQLAGTARDPTSHPRRRKRVTVLAWMLVFTLSTLPVMTGLAAGFVGTSVDVGQSLLFLLDNILKVALLDTLEVFDVNLASIQPADHLARLLTLGVRVAGGLALVELGLTLRRELQRSVTVDGDAEAVERELRTLVLRRRHSVASAPITEPTEEPAEGPPEEEGEPEWQPTPGRGLGWGCAATVLVAMVFWGFVARVVGLFGNHVGTFYGFPSAGTVVMLLMFGGFGLVLLVSLLFNVGGVLLPSSADDEHMSANNLMTISAGLVWVLVMLFMLPDSPLAAGLVGEGDRRFVQLLSYVLDNGLHVVLLDAPDIWGWSISGLKAETTLSRAFAVVFRFAVAWGVLRLASSSRDGVIGGRGPRA